MSKNLNPLDPEADDLSPTGELPPELIDATTFPASPPANSHPDLPEARHDDRPPLPFRTRAQRRRDRSSSVKPNPFHPDQLRSAILSYPSQPDAVKAAAEALASACGRYDEAIRSLLDLDADQAVEAERIELELREAAKAGATAPPQVDRTDWTFEREVRTQRHAQARSDALDMHETYQRAVASSLAAWRVEVAAQIAPSRAKASKGLAALRRDVSAYLAAIEGTRAIDERVDGKARGKGRVQKLRTALADLAVLESDDPAVNGDALVEGPELAQEDRARAAAEREAAEVERALRINGTPAPW